MTKIIDLNKVKNEINKMENETIRELINIATEELNEILELQKDDLLNDYLDNTEMINQMQETLKCINELMLQDENFNALRNYMKEIIKEDN